MSVCIHGGLRRQCETCDLADRLAVAEGNCGHCAHANDEGDDGYGDGFGPRIVCTHADGFYNGTLMQATARCADWQARA